MNLKDPDPILKTSYMKKRSQQKNRLSSKNFKTRWFILTEKFLRYYSGSRDKGFQSLKGQIELNSIKVVEKVDFQAFSDPFVFQVVHFDIGKYNYLYIFADNVEQKSSWITTLINACQAQGAVFFNEYHTGSFSNDLFSCCRNIDRNVLGCVPNSSELSCNHIVSLGNTFIEEPMVEALDSFKSQLENQGSFSIKEGEKLKLLEERADGWWKVENIDGLVGLVPIYRVKKLPIFQPENLWKHRTVYHINSIVLMDFMIKRSQLKKYGQMQSNVCNTRLTHSFMEPKIENFKNRWFVLTKYYLKYYDGMLETGLTSEKGAVLLQSLKYVENVDFDIFLKSNVFQIMYLDENNYYYLYIIADSSNQREKWVRSLQTASLTVGAELSDTYHSGAWFFNTEKFSCCDQSSKNSNGCQLASSE